jgi:hypothetical protein
MIKYNTQPVHSEYRYFQPQVQNNMFNQYSLHEHMTSESHQNNKKTFTFNPNRPHLNIKLDDKHKVRALVDSGSSVCLGDSSLIHHLKHKFPIAPPINVTNVHKGREQTLGCYGARLSVEDPMPYPLMDKPINIHMTKNLSSELVLGTDFLSNHGAIIDIKSKTQFSCQTNTSL